MNTTTTTLIAGRTLLIPSSRIGSRILMASAALAITSEAATLVASTTGRAVNAAAKRQLIRASEHLDGVLHAARSRSGL
jgi:hypothetical protein